MVWASTPNPNPHVCNLLNPHDVIFQRENFNGVEDDVEVVDLSVNETSIEGLDGTPNIDHVKKIIDGRDPPTD